MGKAKAVLPESQAGALEEGDIGQHPGEEAGEEFSDLNEETETTEEVDPKKKVKKSAADEVDDLPDELKGKSLKDIAKMYKEAHSVIGRQGSELGEYRKRVDTLIQASLETIRKGAAPAAPAKTEVSAADSEAKFFAKPREAMAEAIANDPIIKEIRETLGKNAENQAIQRATSATERFQAAHPDAPAIMNDPEFRAWVGASRVRSELLHRAHTQYDFDSGDEIFGTWKALKGINTERAAAEETAAAEKAAAQALAKKKAGLRDAGVPSSGGGAPSNTGSKKIYRRADVIKLMEEDYDRYEQLAPELEAAYREGRVR